MPFSPSITEILKKALGTRNAGQQLGDHLQPQISDAEFTIGAEAADKIIVSIQLKDLNGADLDHRALVRVAVLMDDQTDFTDDTVTFSEETDGKLVEIDTNKLVAGWTTATGALDIGLAITGGATNRLAVELPGGKTVVSDTITHAA